ncbi:hypothetical protein ACQ4PT_052825 [Festuca glaucescens]
MALRRVSLSSFLFLCFHLLAPLLYTTTDAAVSASILQLQAINCSTSGNYSSTDTYAANVNQFLAALPENAVSKNGGFFNGTVGLGPATVYGLAMCPADYSRADCGDCLAGAASSVDGLQSRCPGSTTMLAMFERCLIRYSNVNFFGTPEKGIVHSFSSQPLTTSTPGLYGPLVVQSLKDRSAEAMISPHRFSASAGDPYTFVQCTWDLPADKCRECLDELSDDASNVIAVRMDGQRKSFSCTVGYSNTSFMVVPFTAPSSGPPAQSVDQTGTSAPPSSASGSRAATVAGAVIAVLVVVSLAALIWCVCRPQNKGYDFSYRQLADATGKFAEDNKLGEGAFGAVYKGNLEIEGKQRHVAVKRIMNTTSERVREDFANEITVMREVKHRNIVQLVGSCDESDKLLLVYELMDNGDLEQMLYPEAATIDADVYRAVDLGSSLHLDWKNRQNVLIGMASGLIYLHTECKKCVLHRDIKPSNVMLDKSFNAKLGDFGLVSQVRHTQTSHLTNTVCGTKPYMDPEYMVNGRLSEQSDVYSFGVVLLEMVCGERPAMQNGNKNTLVEKVRECHGRNAILEAADTRLRGPQSDLSVKRLLMLGLLCVQQDPKARPHIMDVRLYLTKPDLKLPSLSGNQTEYTTCSSAPLRRRDEESGEAALL